MSWLCTDCGGHWLTPPAEHKGGCSEVRKLREAAGVNREARFSIMDPQRSLDWAEGVRVTASPSAEQKEKESIGSLQSPVGVRVGWIYSCSSCGEEWPKAPGFHACLHALPKKEAIDIRPIGGWFGSYRAYATRNTSISSDPPQGNADKKCLCGCGDLPVTPASGNPVDAARPYAEALASSEGTTVDQASVDASRTACEEPVAAPCKICNGSYWGCKIKTTLKIEHPPWLGSRINCDCWKTGDFKQVPCRWHDGHGEYPLGSWAASERIKASKKADEQLQPCDIEIDEDAFPCGDFSIKRKGKAEEVKFCTRVKPHIGPCNGAATIDCIDRYSGKLYVHKQPVPHNERCYWVDNCKDGNRTGLEFLSFNYFREGQIDLYDSCPTFFTSAVEARTAAQKMGFTVLRDIQVESVTQCNPTVDDWVKDKYISHKSKRFHVFSNPVNIEMYRPYAGSYATLEEAKLFPCQLMNGGDPWETADIMETLPDGSLKYVATGERGVPVYGVWEWEDVK